MLPVAFTDSGAAAGTVAFVAFVGKMEMIVTLVVTVVVKLAVETLTPVMVKFVPGTVTLESSVELRRVMFVPGAAVISKQELVRTIEDENDQERATTDSAPTCYYQQWSDSQPE